jgi:hypothetical protein
MNTTTAKVFMGQDDAAKTVGIVYLSIVADGNVVDQMVIKDGSNLARRADKALQAKGFFRSTGFESRQGELVAEVIY